MLFGSFQGLHGFLSALGLALLELVSSWIRSAVLRARGAWRTAALKKPAKGHHRIGQVDFSVVVSVPRVLALKRSPSKQMVEENDGVADLNLGVSIDIAAAEPAGGWRAFGAAKKDDRAPRAKSHQVQDPIPVQIEDLVPADVREAVVQVDGGLKAFLAKIEDQGEVLVVVCGRDIQEAIAIEIDGDDGARRATHRNGNALFKLPAAFSPQEKDIL